MKTYLTGSNPSIRVPVRALTLSNGESLRLYDTSGPYTDADHAVDLKQGLPPLRRHWILERDDVEPGAGGRWGLRAKRGRTTKVARPTLLLSFTVVLARRLCDFFPRTLTIASRTR